MASRSALAVSGGQVVTVAATDTIIGTISYGAAQSLTTAQQAQAQTNMGISGVGGAPSAVISTNSGTTQVAAAADKGKTYLLAGSSTLQLPTAVQVSGWYAWVKKSDGNGVWAITPTSSGTAPTIDGLASINCYQESYLIWWDATNSVFRTQGRPKGWVNIGTTTVSSTVASVSFTTGFADPELRDMAFDAENVVPSGSDYPIIRVQKSGTYQTSGYSSEGLYGSSTSAQAFSNATSFFPTSYSLATSGAFFDTTIFSFASTANQAVSTNAWVSGVLAIARGVQNGVSAPITGMQISMVNGSTITAGTINQKGLRP